jgi:hypothetical protein
MLYKRPFYICSAIYVKQKLSYYLNKPYYIYTIHLFLAVTWLDSS